MEARLLRATTGAVLTAPALPPKDTDDRPTHHRPRPTRRTGPHRRRGAAGRTVQRLAGVIVVRREHEGKSVWFRYAHLDPAAISVKPGDQVQPAQRAGLIGAYPKEGDHLHLDCAWESFWWACYRTKDVPWTDPRPILEAHIPVATVAQMLQDRDH